MASFYLSLRQLFLCCVIYLTTLSRMFEASNRWITIYDGLKNSWKILGYIQVLYQHFIKVTEEMHENC
jgi:hypothetical protein